MKGDELFARALQHEIDHLNGVLYIDYLESLEELVRVGEHPDEVRGRDGRRDLVGRIGRIAFLGTGAFGVPLLARAPGAGRRPARHQPARPACRPRPPDALDADRRVRPRARRAGRDPDAGCARTRAARRSARLRARRPAARRLRPARARRPARGRPAPAAQRPSVAPAAPPRRGAGGRHHPGRRHRGRGHADGHDRPSSTPARSSPSGRCRSTGRETTPELEARLADLAAEVVPAELDALGGGRRRRPRRRTSAWPRTIRPFTPRRRLDRLAAQRHRRSTARSAPSSRGRGRGPRSTGGASTSARAHPVPGFDGVPIGALLPGEWPRGGLRPGALALEIVQPEGGRRCPPTRGAMASPREHVLLGGGPPRSSRRLLSRHRGPKRTSAILGAASMEVAAHTMVLRSLYILLVILPSIAITGWARGACGRRTPSGRRSTPAST